MGFTMWTMCVTLCPLTFFIKVVTKQSSRSDKDKCYIVNKDAKWFLLAKLVNLWLHVFIYCETSPTAGDHHRGH